VGAGLSLGAALGLAGVAEAADYTVDRLDDPAGAGVCATATPNDCSLRQAVMNTQNSNQPLVDDVFFQSGLSGTATLVNGGLVVGEPLEFHGPGAGVLTVSGGDSQRGFSIDTAAGEPVTISGLTVTHAYGSGSVGGGAIYSKDADLTVESSTVSESVGGISGAHYPGGGIRQVNGSLLIRNSTISGNKGGNGGGVHADNADVGIQNSTISGNTATGTGGGSGLGYGGGMWLNAGATGSLIVYGSTIADNHAVYGGGVSAAPSSGNGIASTVIADNTATGAPDLRTAGVDPFKLAFTLVESTDGADIEDIAPYAGSNILDTDPQLGPLVANGGPTWTHKPAPASPVVDKGLTVGGPTDQRGLGRPFDVPSIPNSTVVLADGSDIGSVELQAADFATAAQPSATPPPQAKKNCKKPKKKKKKKCKRKRRKKR
jgi:hypothetical protein